MIVKYSHVVAGAFLASLTCSLLAKRITIAKLYHFDSESEGDALLRRNLGQGSLQIFCNFG
jgi:hypothetical protein